MIEAEGIYESLWRDSFSLFCCNEDEDITNFMRKKAVEYEKRDRCRTYIYFDERYLEETGRLKVVAFFSLALKTISIPVIDTMSKTLQRRFGKLADKDENIVAYLIGQLGRSSDYNKTVINGKKMLQDCYDLIGSARDIVGGRLILIECKRINKVCQFYENEGYIDITENGDDLEQYVRFMK